MARGNATRGLFAAAALAVAMAACGNREEKRAQVAADAAVDSMAAARARGEVDLTNPEMGSKVLLTLTEYKVAQSHTEIARGQVTFVVANKGQKPHEFEITGPGGRWKSMAIAPGTQVLMSMLIDPGVYSLYSVSTDSTGTDKEKGMTAKIKVL